MLGAKSQNGRFYWSLDKGRFSESGPLRPKRTLSAVDTLLLFDVLVTGVTVTKPDGAYTWSMNADGSMQEIGPDATTTFPEVDVQTLREMFLICAGDIARYAQAEATGIPVKRKWPEWKYDDEGPYTTGVEGVEAGDAE